MRTSFVCKECTRMSRGVLRLSSVGPSGYALTQGSVKLVDPVLISRGLPLRPSWSSEHNVIAHAAPAQLGQIPTNPAFVRWHVRLVNVSLTFGDRHVSLCRLRDSSVEIFKDQPQVRISEIENVEDVNPPGEVRPEDWVTFASGHWTRAVPQAPGLYPVRGVYAPKNLHTVRVVSGGNGPEYYLDNDQRSTALVLEKTLWFWTQIMPELPGLPLLTENE